MGCEGRDQAADDVMKMTDGELLTELKRRGIEHIWIGACGCCQSPWVTVRFDDGKVFRSEDRNIGTPEDD